VYSQVEIKIQNIASMFINSVSNFLAQLENTWFTSLQKFFTRRKRRRSVAYQKKENDSRPRFGYGYLLPGDWIRWLNHERIRHFCNDHQKGTPSTGLHLLYPKQRSFRFHILRPLVHAGRSYLQRGNLQLRHYLSQHR